MSVCVRIYKYGRKDKGEGMWKVVNINIFFSVKLFKMLKNIVVFFLNFIIGLLIKFFNIEVEMF